jgi:hypothetical protein
MSLSSHPIAHLPAVSAADVVAALARAGRPLGGDELALRIRAPRGDAMRALLDAVRRHDVRATTEPGDETLRWTLAARPSERAIDGLRFRPRAARPAAGGRAPSPR